MKKIIMVGLLFSLILISVRSHADMLGGTTGSPGGATQTIGGVFFNYTSSTMTVSSASVVGTFYPPSYPVATIRTRTPSSVGEILYCNNCTYGTICVATGTAVNAYAIVGSTQGACL